MQDENTEWFLLNVRFHIKRAWHEKWGPNTIGTVDDDTCLCKGFVQSRQLYDMSTYDTLEWEEDSLPLFIEETLESLPPTCLDIKELACIQCDNGNKWTIRCTFRLGRLKEREYEWDQITMDSEDENMSC